MEKTGQKVPQWIGRIVPVLVLAGRELLQFPPITLLLLLLKLLPLLILSHLITVFTETYNQTQGTCMSEWQVQKFQK